MFDSQDTVRCETNKSHSLKPTIKVTEPLTIEKRSFSDSSLVDIVIEGKLKGLLFSSIIQRAFPRIAPIRYQTIASILSFFRNVVTESNQIDSLKNRQNDPFFMRQCLSVSFKGFIANFSGGN